MSPSQVGASVESLPLLLLLCAAHAQGAVLLLCVSHVLETDNRDANLHDHPDCFHDSHAKWQYRCQRQYKPLWLPVTLDSHIWQAAV